MHEVSSYKVSAELSLAYQLSAATCRAVQCRYRKDFRVCQVSLEVSKSYQVPVLLILHQIYWYCSTLLNHTKCTTRAAQPRYGSVAKRSAVRCRPVRCRAVCPAVRRCAVLRYAFFFEHTEEGIMPSSARYQLPVCMCVQTTRIFAFFI